MISQLMMNSIENAVRVLFNELGIEEEGPNIRVQIEQPAHLEHGDYSTNVAMQLAKHLRKAPIQIAALLKAQLEQDGSVEGLLSRIEVAPPGFINLYIDWNQWAQRHFRLPGHKVEKVVIEHTSINPNKSAHIGHLRNACIGDALVRLMRRTGYEVEVHNYIDDLGNQLADTVVGLLNLSHKQDHARFGDFCWDIYSSVNKAYQNDPQLLGQRTSVLHSLEEGDENLSWVGLLVAERIVRDHLDEMNAFGINYDLLVWESNIVREGFWAAAFELLIGTTLFYKETTGKLEGCWVLKQAATDEEAADSEHQADKVLVRSNGILTYTAKDIAYHLWKFGLLDKDFKYKRFSEQLWTTNRSGTSASFGQADIVINVIDHRQGYPQAMVKQALEVLGYTDQAEKLRHVSYGVVSLSPGAARELGIDTSDGKASYAMSGRQGIGIKISDLLDRMETIIETKRSDKSGLSSRIIAAAAIRYYLLRYNLSTEVVFDIQQATEVTGNTGVYLMYAYARAVNILTKAESESESNSQPVVPDAIEQLDKAEYALLRHLATWQDTLYEASRELSPNVICNYAHELATLFSNFYAACPILKAGEDRKPLRLWLAYKFKETIGDALTVLGLPTPNRM